MTKHSDHQAGGFKTENTGGVLAGFLAEEDQFDRRALWRLGSWGGAAVGTVIVAVLANQSSMRSQREQVASADLVRQSQQIQSVAKESQNETRRLTSAIDTLNGDRDRLYARVTILEQGLDSVTGAIARQTSSAVAPQTASAPLAMTEPPSVAKDQAPAPAPAPVVSALTTTIAKKTEKPPTVTSLAEQGLAMVSSVGQAAPTPTAAAPTTSLVASKPTAAPPDTAKLIEPEPKPIGPEKPANAVAAPAKPDVVAHADEAGSDSSPAQFSKVAVQRTEFGVDIGGANSVGGLRALWRGLLKSRSNAALTTLSPIIVIKEGNNGLGMQLRLVAGPLDDAAAAAKICAGLTANEQPCQTTVFDGQRLAMKIDEPAAAAPTPAPAKPVARRRNLAKRVTANEEPPKAPEPPSTLSSLFGRR
jgi:hypothetical protein